MNEFKILKDIKTQYEFILKEKLVGIYVHGSIAFECFNWNKSDIDFLVVVNKKISTEEKEKLITVILELDAYCPVKGIEMSVVLDKVCNPFIYPTPYELHYSNSYRESYKSNLSRLCDNLNGTDKDLAAHITVINQVGIILCGKEICDVFGNVPKENYIDSILYDVEEAGEQILRDPVYFILNLCRGLAYMKEDVVFSKQQGGEWGIDNLPGNFKDMITNALECYSENVEFRQSDLLQEFANYMLKEIRRITSIRKQQLKVGLIMEF